ncbi:hypothetical protein V6N12_070495 [Hibiscus sabdariffa]|uniref:Uncharacterized protein n=1 Tax=Hibiscus sabdariffa TaxID=183260 RepID=A0ABR2FGZ3_9ROSI
MSNPSVLLASSSVQVAISLSGRPPDFQSDWLALQSLGALRVPDLEANQSMGVLFLGAKVLRIWMRTVCMQWKQPRREDSALLLFMGHGLQDSEEVLDSLLPTLDVVRNRSSDPTSAKGTHRFNPKSSLRQGNKLGKKGVKKWSDLEIVAPSAPTSLGEAEGFGVSTLEERIGHQGSMAERVISIDERGSDGGEVLKEVPTQIRGSLVQFCLAPDVLLPTTVDRMVTETCQWDVSRLSGYLLEFVIQCILTIRSPHASLVVTLLLGDGRITKCLRLKLRMKTWRIVWNGSIAMSGG